MSPYTEKRRLKKPSASDPTPKGSDCVGAQSAVKNAACGSNLASFDHLPESAHIRIAVVKQLYAISAATVYRHMTTGLIPAPRHFGARITAWNVGDLRTALAG